MDKTEAAKSPPHKHGVVAVLQDAQGRYLLIRRGLTIQRAPGFWCFVGGEVEAGESYEAAIQREVREEVGLDVEALEKIHETQSPNREFRLHWMRCRLMRDGQTVQPHATEVAEARWVSAEEALRLDPLLPALRGWLVGQQPGGPRIHVWIEAYQTDEVRYPYDERYTFLFQLLRELVLQTAPGCAVEHAGGTAVRGRAGRRIIDIRVPAPPERRAVILSRLEDVGFQPPPDGKQAAGLRVGALLCDGQRYNVHVFVG